MEIKIRIFKISDARDAAEIIKEGWTSLISKDYSKTAVENQIDGNTPEKLIEKSKHIHYFIAEHKNIIVGIGGFSKEKIQTFFVTPKYHKMGIGSALIKRVLTEAKKDGIQSLDCWSTFQAESFYTLYGFTKKRIIFVDLNEFSITFVLMNRAI